MLLLPLLLLVLLVLLFVGVEVVVDAADVLSLVCVGTAVGGAVEVVGGGVLLLVLLLAV